MYLDVFFSLPGIYLPLIAICDLSGQNVVESTRREISVSVRTRPCYTATLHPSRDQKHHFTSLSFAFCFFSILYFADAHFRYHDVYAGCCFLLPGREPLICYLRPVL